MKNSILVIFLQLSLWGVNYAQAPASRHIRIVDTLTPAEKTGRNPVILQSELDSLVKEYNMSNAWQNPVQNQKQETLKAEKNNNGLLITVALMLIILLLGLLMYLVNRHHQKMNSMVAGFQKKADQALNHGSTLTVFTKGKTGKNKQGTVSVETKISDLNAELHKLSRENEGLNRVIREYNGIRHEYDSLKHGMSKAFKIKKYPGNELVKDETAAMQGVLETENNVARYAYDKFLKPILLITDTNKNSPAKISAADSEKLMDLLVSLSLLYIEYLYLRVNELSIGGKMVERIQGFAKGKGPDPALLRQLDKDFGSRALVIRMALDKARLQQLSYPVFDETNLNH